MMMMLAVPDVGAVSVVIKRVVSCFLMKHVNNNTTPLLPVQRDDHDDPIMQIAVFHRVHTMPTYPNHWATCSGGIEPIDETPWDACLRELNEETNFIDLVNIQQQQQPLQHTAGLFVDVPYTSPRSGQMSIIRVYPFAITIPTSSSVDMIESSFELRGTEHDTMKWITVQELEQLEPAVPELARAFHHATAGKYYDYTTKYGTDVATQIHSWSTDTSNGASIMAQNAIQLISNSPIVIDPKDIMMLRPSMVAITNAMNAVIIKNTQQRKQQQQQQQQSHQVVLDSMQADIQRSIRYAVRRVRELIKLSKNENNNNNNNNATKHDDAADRQCQHYYDYTIALFSRSSTLKQIIHSIILNDEQESDDDDTSYGGVLLSLRVLCSKSVPGGEGILMAQDILEICNNNNRNIRCVVECVDDDKLIDMIRNSNNNNNNETIHMILTGCDCITEHHVVNKIGTKALLVGAVANANTKYYCDNLIPQKKKKIHVLCCADPWKVWDDIYPPPLEPIFECIPKELYDEILLPPPSSP